MALIKVEICAGTSCHLLGNQVIIDALENMPEFWQKQIRLGYRSCLGNCGRGPCVTIGEQVLEQASPEKVLAVLKQQLGAGKIKKEVG